MKTNFVPETAGAAALTKRLRSVMTRLGEALGLAHCSVSVMLTSDARIREFNRLYRRHDEVTDVLSFPTGAGDRSASGHYLGDLVVSLERAEEQARAHGHALEDEVEVLVLHGLLHLLGHDHETDGGEMRAIERRIAQQVFGEARGLIDRSEPDTGRGPGTGHPSGPRRA